MVGKLTRTAIVAGAVATVLFIAAGQAQAGGHHASSNLLQNYYVPPGPCGGVGSQMYVAPRPTPPLVGHTYITYPPLMPHEWMRPHSRYYIRRNPAGGLTTTSVMWTRSLLDFSWLHHGPRVLPSPPISGKGHYNAGWVRNK